jgi:asparagine synthetase B (glutamine-hydrolysing)
MTEKERHVMGFAKSEREWAQRVARHLKTELKRADVTYEELAERLKEHGFSETKASISNKLARATVPASFFLACLAALELEGVSLEDI